MKAHILLSFDFADLDQWNHNLLVLENLYTIFDSGIIATYSLHLKKRGTYWFLPRI